MSRTTSHRALLPRILPIAALGILSAAALLATPAVASAGQRSAAALQMQVHYDAHDLATERGTRKIYLRILDAARDVCPGYDSRDGIVMAAGRVCERRAIAGALAEIGNARLAALDAQVTPYLG